MSSVLVSNESSKWPMQRIFSRSSLVRIGWRTSRRLRCAVALEVEQVRPRPDERHEAHDELLADRIDRRVRHLREVLLEIGVEQLRLATTAPRSACPCPSSRPLPGRSIAIGAAGSTGLPACSRRPAGDRAATRRCATRAARPAVQLLEHDLGAARATPCRDARATASA